MGTLRHIFGVSFCTLLSRITGLLRDILLYATFGTSELNNAFLYGFMLPNMFRALLGEGALNSALIPIFSDVYHREGRDAAYNLLNQVLSRLARLLIGIICLGVILLSMGYCYSATPHFWKLCTLFSAILLPYMFFVCLAAVLTAVLNVLDKFLFAACNSIWLNLSMIVSLLIGYHFSCEIAIYILCFGVLLGGVIQLLSLWYALKQHNWKFHWDTGFNENIRLFKKLFLPGILGAAIFQINTAVSRVLAGIVNRTANSVLYLSNRLIELPLGLFVIASTTVIFPKLSQFEAQGDQENLRNEFRHGTDFILMIIVPAVVGLFCLGRTILQLFFQWRAFTTSDVALVLPVLQVYIFSLPFYALVTFFVRAYHCKKDTRRPMIYSAVNFLVNIALTLLLMFRFETLGVAIANLLSTMIQSGLLFFNLKRCYPIFNIPIFSPSVLRYCFASVAMGCVVSLLDLLFHRFCFCKTQDLLSVAVNVPLGILIYFGLVYYFLPEKDRDNLRTIGKQILKKFFPVGNRKNK